MSWALNVPVPLSNVSRAVMLMEVPLPSVRVRARKVRSLGCRSLEGWHPGLFSLEHPWELRATFDPELRVRAGEVTLHGLERHEELLGDLAVGAALGREMNDPQLAWREGLHAGAPLAPRAGAGRLELLACAGT